MTAFLWVRAESAQHTAHSPGLSCPRGQGRTERSPPAELSSLALLSPTKLTTSSSLSLFQCHPQIMINTEHVPSRTMQKPQPRAGNIKL